MSSTLAPQVTGNVPKTFAFNSIRNRWPKILCKIVDQYSRKIYDLKEGHQTAKVAEIKEVIAKISELRYRIETNKPLLKFDAVPDGRYDAWNAHLDEVKERLGEDKLTWFDPPWLFTECYMYARVRYFFEHNHVHVNNDDYFIEDKTTALNGSIAHIKAIACELLEWEKSVNIDERAALSRLLQVQLWGNKCDLSLTGGDTHSMAERFFEDLAVLRPNILSDHLDAAVNHLLTRCQGRELHIVLDNAALELFTDLALAEFVVARGLVKTVVFHFKAFPWFVSDALVSDFRAIVDRLSNDTDEILYTLGRKWSKRKEFVFRSEPFWTTSRSYWEMKTHAPTLFDDLRNASLVIFKGDLNGRKLLDDRSWPYETPYETAIQSMSEVPFLSLRTLKAETVAGLPAEAVANVEKTFGKSNLEWMVSSDYAVVQLNLPVTKP